MNALSYRLSNISLPLRAGIADMLMIFSFQLSEDVSDINIPYSNRPIIYINPHFIEQYCKTDEHLFMLVFSEVYRLRLCQTESFQGETKEAEIAARAMVNSFLCTIFPEEEYTSFFMQFYDENQFPECMLRPPSNFPAPASYPHHLKKDITELWSQIYYGSTLEYAELTDHVSLMLSAQRMRGFFDFPILIGGKYCTRKKSIDQKKFYIFLNLLSHVAIDPKLIPSGVVGRSLCAAEMEYKLKINPNQSPNKILEKAIFRAARTCHRSSYSQKTYTRKEIIQAWPSRDRKAFAVSATGFPSLLYRNNTLFSEYAPRAVDIYFDVSGSMFRFITYCAEAIISCSKKIKMNLWLFSIGIQPLTIEDLEKGNVPSYGGTSIDEVVEHIVHTKATSVVIITDGEVGPIPKEHAKYCKSKVNVQVVYTPEYFEENLAPITNKKHVFQAQRKT